MNKKICMCLCILLLFGCNKGVKYEDVQVYYQKMLEYTGTYKYEVDSNGVFSYVCNYSLNKEGAELVITEPQELMGIKAVTDKDGTKLEYEGVGVKTYLPSNDGFAPVSALHSLILDLRTKQPKLFTAGETIEITFDEKDYIKKAVLSKDDYMILSCEYFYKNDRILNITLQ